MIYDTTKMFEISYYDNKRDDMIQCHTDSLSRAVVALISRSRKHPTKTIELTFDGGKLMGQYKDGEYFWQHDLTDAWWQRWIKVRLNK